MQFLLRVVRGLLRRVLKLFHAQVRRAPAPAFARAAEYRAFFESLETDTGEYLRRHMDRLVRTMTLVPAANGSRYALELGSYMQIAPALKALCGYEVRGAYFGKLGESATKKAIVRGRGPMPVAIDLFNAELDRFPYMDGEFSLVLACEIIEHLLRDPMHMLAEINRVLGPGGRVILTTPNCASWTSVARVLNGLANPQIYSAYDQETPHVREYTPHELRAAMRAAGFDIEWLFTEQIPGLEERAWVDAFLLEHGFDTSLRGEQMYCVARKAGPVRERYPTFLYAR